MTDIVQELTDTGLFELNGNSYRIHKDLVQRVADEINDWHNDLCSAAGVDGLASLNGTLEAADQGWHAFCAGAICYESSLHPYDERQDDGDWFTDYDFAMDFLRTYCWYVRLRRIANWHAVILQVGNTGQDWLEDECSEGRIASGEYYQFHSFNTSIYIFRDAGVAMRFKLAN